MKILLIVKAAVEASTGISLTLFPSAILFLLLGSSLYAAPGKVVCWIAGAALFAIGIACWTARNEARSHAAIGLLAGTMVYDAAVVVILLLARFHLGLLGMALWPAVALHLGLAASSVVCIRQASRV